MGTRGRRGGRNEREAGRAGRGVGREAWWAWRPGEAGRRRRRRRGRAGNERRGGRRETDRARANGMNLKRGKGQRVKDGVPGEQSNGEKQKVKQHHRGNQRDE